MDLKARVLERRRIFKGRVVDLGLERVRLPNGAVTELEIIRHQGAAAAVPLTASGEVVLVRQYRHAVGEWLLEVPAGKLEPGEDPESCSLREVEEEVGLRPKTMTPLGPIWTTPGFTNERIWLFLATDLEPGRQALEDDESLSVERMLLPRAVDAVRRGEICDAKSIVALLRAEQVVSRRGREAQPRR
ncbi:MAG: NUDIX hydrolase [Acidobacteriota bacterium]|nr:NUDIX hydrolase [Acidobacteriota bacterium]